MVKRLCGSPNHTDYLTVHSDDVKIGKIHMIKKSVSTGKQVSEVFSLDDY